MMIDVDGLIRWFDTLSSQYAHITLLSSTVDYKAPPLAYTDSIIGCAHAAKIETATDENNALVLIITTSAIK